MLNLTFCELDTFYDCLDKKFKLSASFSRLITIINTISLALSLLYPNAFERRKILVLLLYSLL